MFGYTCPMILYLQLSYHVNAPKTVEENCNRIVRVCWECCSSSCSNASYMWSKKKKENVFPFKQHCIIWYFCVPFKVALKQSDELSLIYTPVKSQESSCREFPFIQKFLVSLWLLPPHLAFRQAFRYAFCHYRLIYIL